MPTCNICKYAGRPIYKSPCSECKGFSKYEYEKLQTNADRIRGMSDEELAWELMTWRCEAAAKYHGVESQYPDTQKTILLWLQKQSKENEHGQAYFAGKDNP